MYENLKAEMARKDITLMDMSEQTGIRYQTLSEKIRGNQPFKLKEAVAIKNVLNIDMSIDELFGEEVK